MKVLPTVVTRAPRAETVRAPESHAPDPEPSREVSANKSVLGGDKIASSGTEAPPLPSRRLPVLRDAIADAGIEPLPPASVNVPEETLAVLRNAKRILVVGHVPPDGDCVGSALGLMKALRAIGKDAVAVIDDELPAQSRAIDTKGEVKRFADAGDGFDLVVLVDVAGTKRIGAVGAALPSFANVLVIDHHEVVPSHESLGLAAGAKLTTFLDPHADAAAVLVAGVAAHLEPGSSRAFDAAKQTLACSMYTDTLGFKSPGAQMKTLQLFKGVVSDVPSVDALERALNPELPAGARAILDAVKPTVRGKGAQRTASLRIERDTFARALAAAQTEDPRTCAQDLRAYLQQQTDALRDRYGFASVAIDEGEHIRVSFRSKHETLALQVAQTLDGGGHGRNAATIVKGRSLDDVVAAIETSLRAQQAHAHAKLRVGR